MCRPRATVAMQQANVDLPFTTRLMPRTWFGLKGHNKPAQGIALGFRGIALGFRGIALGVL